VGQVGRFLERACSGVESAAIGGVGVADVDVEESGRQLANSRVADHDKRVADLDHRRSLAAIRAGGAEDSAEELHQLPGVAGHDTWRHRVPAFRREPSMCVFHRPSLSAVTCSAWSSIWCGASYHAPCGHNRGEDAKYSLTSIFRMWHIQWHG